MRCPCWTRLKRSLTFLIILGGLWILLPKIIFHGPPWRKQQQSNDPSAVGDAFHFFNNFNYWRKTEGEGRAGDRNLKKEKYLVNTPGCKIPATRLFTDFHLKAYYGVNWSMIKTEAGLADLLRHNYPAKQWIPDCRQHKKLSSLKENDAILQLHPKYVNKNCSLIEIGPHSSSEENFSFIPRGDLIDRRDVTKLEMFMTQCGPHLNFDARFPEKPGVLKKIAFWKKRRKSKKKRKKNKNDDPINVLWIAFDSISRSQFHRAIPRSMKVLLKDLNFTDFRGYHAVSPHTVHNLDGLLYGGGDSFVWNHFGRHNYVTMFSNDNENSFVYGKFFKKKGGMGGKKSKIYEPPTDYFLRPVFAAQAKFAENRRYKCKRFCMSSADSTSTFQLKYIEKFVSKFSSSTPFFTFNWLNDPFHDTTLSLTDMDEPLAKFLDGIAKIKNILENTLIIIQADHGERYGFFETESIESYVERSLPGFFIRLPNKLTRGMPHLHAALIQNSRRLTYPHDIHHTLLHTLVLSGLDPSDKVSVTQFSAAPTPKQGDRSSLLVPISEDRNCKQLNIKADGSCICDSVMMGEVAAIRNPFAIQKMISFAVSELNSIIRSSKFSSNCSQRELNIQPQISADALNENETFTDVLLRFEADPHDAQFEVKLRVGQQMMAKEGVGEEGQTNFWMKRIGTFSRINRYGDESWCVQPVLTDEDKLMKEYCHCLEELETNSV